MLYAGVSDALQSPDLKSKRDVDERSGMGFIAITGSASGIGAATRAHLERLGTQVIGIDLRDAEIVADLASESGRQTAIAAVKEKSQDRLDGLVLCAGVGPRSNRER